MNQLPDHILLEIFSYFDGHRLMELMKVSDRWSHLISSSRSTKKHFSVFNIVQTDGTFTTHNQLHNGFPSNFVIASKRAAEDFHENKIPEILAKIDEYKIFMEIVRFKGHIFKNMSPFLKLVFTKLKDFVKEIELSDCEMGSNRTCNAVHFKQLESLKIENSTTNFLQIFKGAPLKKLVLSRSNASLQDNNLARTIFNDFWKSNLKNLEELHISSVRGLKYACEGLADFLKSSKLKTLELDISVLSENSYLLDKVIEMSHWKELHFRNGPCLRRLCKTAKVIMAGSQGIKVLKIQKASFENENLVSHIYDSVPNIEYLRLPLVLGNIQPSEKILFRSLDILEIEGIKYKMCVQKLLMILQMCPNLRVFRVFWIGHHARITETFFTRIFENARKLEELQVGCDLDTFELTKQMVDVVKEKGRNLKKMTVYTANMAEMLNVMRIIEDGPVRCVVLHKNYEKFCSNWKIELVKMESDKEYKPVTTCLWKD